MTTIKMKDIINNAIMMLKRKLRLLSAKRNNIGNAKYYAAV